MMHRSSVSDKFLSSQLENFAEKKTGYDYFLF